jgi:hypothetical protein
MRGQTFDVVSSLLSEASAHHRGVLRMSDAAPNQAEGVRDTRGFKANLREDTGEVLGIVSDEYEVYLHSRVIRGRPRPRPINAVAAGST